MKQASYYNYDGEIVGTIFATVDEIKINTPPGCHVVEGLWSDGLYWVKDGVPTAYTPDQLATIACRPGVLYTWSNKLMTWVGEYNSLELYQKTINDDIEYKGNIYQADKKSYENMLNVYQSALITNDAVRWKLKNNEWVDIGVDDLKELIRMIHRRNQQAFEKK